MPDRKTVLVADDEKEIRDLIRIYLEKDGYVVMEAADGLAALELVKSADILLLDIMMPNINGITVLQQIRDGSNIPVIIISARTAYSDRILGLDLGADDYIVKPFDPMEVVARVTANLRRFYKLGSQAENGQILRVKDLELDRDACLLRQDKVEIPLTSVEFRIMKMFMEHPGRVFTKQNIYMAGWEEDRIVDDNSIMVCVSKLRAKLNDSGSRYISTIRGLGYRFEK